MKLTYKFINDEKNLSIEKIDVLAPEQVLVYIKEGDTLYIKNEEYVYRNQLIKKSANGIKTYASVSGKCKIDDRTITITNDCKEQDEGRTEAIEKISELSKSEILKKVEDLGIEYDNKLIVNNLKEGGKVLVVNGIDVEPYQFNNNYLFQDNVKDLLDTINLIAKKFELEAYLLLNDYDDNNVNLVNSYIGSYPNIKFKILKETFPYNANIMVAEKYFTEYKLADMVFMDTMVLYKIFIALKRNLPVNERYVTICCKDLDKVYMVKAKYGTLFKEVLKPCIGDDRDNKDFYINNFMRKIKCGNIDSLIVSDNIKTVFITDKNEDVELGCIKCGKCVDICPVKINPMDKKLNYACIRCGLCNYVCPANINLINKEK